MKHKVLRVLTHPIAAVLIGGVFGGAAGRIFVRFCDYRNPWLVVAFFAIVFISSCSFGGLTVKWRKLGRR